MSAYLQKAVHSSPALRDLAWRAGRRLYTSARGEPLYNDIGINGEAYVQTCVIDAVPADVPLVIADIGANQGDWTASYLDLLSKRRPQGALSHVHLFEPVPATSERLRKALAGPLAERQASLHACAISDAPGNATMAILSETGGTNTLHDFEDGVSLPKGYERVSCITFAEFCEREKIGTLHLVKCDTEGHDLQVLMGAKSLLAEGRIEVFQFEYNHRWIFARNFLKDVFDLVAGLPYQVARIMPDHIEVLPGWHPELERYFEANYALVKDSAVDWFDARWRLMRGTNTLA